MWGIKTFYYSLINKAGSKSNELDDAMPLPTIMEELEEDCEACKL
jgi:hypothetical protein